MNNESKQTQAIPPPAPPSGPPAQQAQFNSKAASWRQWNWTEDIDPKVAFARAMLTLVIIWVAYTCFQFSWQVVNQANNYQGPVYTLFPQSAADPSVNRASNWSITIVRGLVSVAIGLLINQIGHKKAMIFSFSIFLCSFPFILTPYMKDSMLANGADDQSASQACYALFVIFRLFLSVGGAALMIAQAPLIAKFFGPKPKVRNATMKIGQVPAQAAGILASLIFINGVVAAGASYVASQWQLISGIILIIVAAMFGCYLFVGMHFNIAKPGPKKAESLSDADAAQNKISWLFKQPKVVIFLVAGLFSLYAGIEPGSGILQNFWKTTANNQALTWGENGLPGSSSSVSTTMLIWQMLYCASIFTGIATIGKWSNTRYPIARYSGVMICLGTALWAISFGMGAAGLDASTAYGQGIMAGVLIFGLLGSTCIFGTQSLTGIIPFRWHFTTQQINNYTACSWTMMYVGYSILDIITSYIGTAGVSAHMATISDYISNHPGDYQSLFNTQYFTANGIGTSAMNEQLSTYYGSFKNIMLGADVNNITSSVQESINKLNAAGASIAYTPADILNYGKITDILSVNGTPGPAAINQSFANASMQYVPQICIISIAPIIAGIIYLFIKKTDQEIPFTFKHFSQHHMHFSNLKRLSNKWFKTNYRVEEAEAVV